MPPCVFSALGVLDGASLAREGIGQALSAHDCGNRVVECRAAGVGSKLTTTLRSLMTRVSGCPWRKLQMSAPFSAS